MPERLPRWNYAANGAYFLTVCTHARVPAFGSIGHEGRVQLAPLGMLLSAQLVAAVKHRPGMALDTWVIMPDHLHAIILVEGHENGLSSVLQLVAAVKAGVTMTGRQMGIAATGARLWQRGFFDRVIRSEQELNRLRDYIETNPARWVLARGASVGQSPTATPGK